MKSLKIFAHRGIVGAESDIENGSFINDPKVPGQLGIIVRTENAQITAEARELIKNAPREGGSFAPIMLTKHEGEENIKVNGKGSIGMLGFWKHIFKGDDLCIGRTCELEILDDIEVVDEETPADFIEFIDSVLDGEEASAEVDAENQE